MKKTRSDSAESAVKAMVNASKAVPSVPKHCRLRAGDRPFWDGIVCARGLDEWTDADLVVAAQLARCQADIEAEQIALDAEGSVIKNDRGTVVMNARVTVLEQLARREMALMRTLRMGGAAAGRAENVGNKRKLERESRKLRAELSENEELLAS